MKAKLISSRLVLTLVAGLAVGGLHAQSSNVVATATLSDVPGTSGNFDYTLTVHNAGNVPIEGVWYAWIPGGNTSPTALTVPFSASGWSASVSGSTSIQFQGTAIESIGPGGTGTFTFDTTSTLTQMTTGTTGPGATGESVAFATTIGFTGNSPGVSAEFTPTAVPEPSSFGLFAFGSLGLLAKGWRKLR